MVIKITEKELLKAGYKKHTAYHIQCADFLYQKVIYSKNKEKKLYFINFYFYEGQYGGWSVEVRFYTHNEEMSIELLLNKNHTVRGIEKTYANLYKQIFV
jgi:hypothetical protein